MALLQAWIDGLTPFSSEVRVHQIVGGLTPTEVWNGQGIHAITQRYGQCRWIHALDGLLLGYRLRR